jgi:hypothetical protein
MAVISPNSFDPLKRYVGVRLQQGVPIADRDWNELEDTLKFEQRAFLRWFIGNGIPEGSNAFQIIGSGLTNDFTISVGGGGSDGLSAGRCLVDGMSVFITSDFTFASQPLHVSQAGSTALAAALGVPRIDMPAPEAGTLAAYLDVWERLVTPAEDPSLVLPGLGTESCARVKRELAVRVRSGTTSPILGDANFLPSHSYYLLATIARRNGDPLINAADVGDRRQTRLTMAALEQRMRILERLVLIPVFAPSPNQFSPKIGAPGVNVVTLFGSNFNVSPPLVQFGATKAVVVSFTATQIVATVPVTPAGAVKITVQTSGGTVTSDDNFTILAPPPPTPPTFAASPNQFTPKVGAAGTNVTLFGSNLNVGTPAVRFGAVNATVVSFTPTQIVTTVPAMACVATKITVQTTSGTVISDDNFTVL